MGRGTQNERSGYRLDYRCHRAGVVHDTAGAGAVLRRACTCPKCTQRLHALLRHCLLDERLYTPCFGSSELFDLSIAELMNIEVYSANKSPLSIQDISASVTVLTRKQIEKFGFSTMDDLLRHIPGLFLIDTYRDQLIGTRGSIGGSIAFLVNGVLLHPASTPGIRTDLRGRMNISVEAIDRIEYVRAPQAVTYGDSAF